MIPFKVDPSWYERYWWSDPAPDRTAYRADKACRERLLRAAGAMKVALDSLVRTVWSAAPPDRAIALIVRRGQSLKKRRRRTASELAETPRRHGDRSHD